MKIKGRSHTPEEKQKILDRIFAVWTQPGFDQQRLGQLLDNALVTKHQVIGPDLHMIEDEMLAETVEAFFDKFSKII